MPTDPTEQPAAPPAAQPSPYLVALGAEYSGLHPRLSDYFGGIPAGSVGTGRGVFDRVGTPRRWLWPALHLLGRAGVVFPVWERDVPFTVHNRPSTGSSGPAVNAERRFRFRSGDRVMADVISAGPRSLTDRLGSPALVEAHFACQVVDGGLLLRSTRVRFLLGRIAVTVPRFAAPVVQLSERFDDDADRQRVLVTIDAPLLGRLYEYGGTFSYSVGSEGGTS